LIKSEVFQVVVIPHFKNLKCLRALMAIFGLYVEKVFVGFTIIFELRVENPKACDCFIYF